MKIGDKVRFLSAVGGGIVKGFQGKDIVLVEEEDGFETPVLIRECVVIEDNENQYRQPAPRVAVAAQPAPVVAPTQPKEEPRYEELPGGDRLNLYIAYLPDDIKNLTQGHYEAYLVNDSNYFLYYHYMARDNASWRSLSRGEIEPNTKLFIHEFSKEDLNGLENICLQCMAYKKDKAFALKNVYSVELRLNTVKFYKVHCFRENDFFEEDAIVYPIIQNDLPEREMLVLAAELQEAMMEKRRDDRLQAKPARESKPKQSAVVEVDLHASELLETTAGMSNSDILEYQLAHFREVLEKYKGKKGQKIVFIHGKGEGVLRTALEKELKTKFRPYSFQDASFREYGFGATMVTIK